MVILRKARLLRSLSLKPVRFCIGSKKWISQAAVNNQLNPRETARQIYDAAVCSVLPQTMVKTALTFEGKDNLMIDGRFYKLNKNVHIAAFGKAVAGMVRAAEDILGDHIVQGVASVPSGIKDLFIENGKIDFLPRPNSRVNMIEGSLHNIPDARAENAAIHIANMAKSLKKDDILLTLISGGGSALLPSPIPPITLEDMAVVTQTLQSHGANILQLNLVRKNIELLKGGGLAKLAHPAQVVSLIISDVIGDPLDLIASGPTVKDSSSPRQCLSLFDLLKARQQIPERVISFLERKVAEYNEPDKNDIYSHATSLQNISYAHNVIVGSNKIAINAAAEEATKHGYIPYILSTTLDGDARQAGLLFAEIANFICSMHGGKHSEYKIPLPQQELNLINKGMEKESINDIVETTNKGRNTNWPICILAGGETTVNVTGTGKGGRSQEMALTAAIELHNLSIENSCLKTDQVTLLCGGTDGQDGPTPAAGALADTDLMPLSHASGLDARSHLDNNDAYTFFSKLTDGQYLLNPGLTGTNVMDIQVMLINS